MKKALIGLLLTLAGIAALALIPSTQPKAPMPWEVTVMSDGNSEVFGVHLGKTSYKEAQEHLKEYGEAAIFTQEGKDPSVEAFFQSINLGGLSAKLILTLVVDQSSIDTMISHALQARIQPSGARKYELDNQAHIGLMSAVVKTLTYIPSVKLNDEMVTYRFGEPQEITKDKDDANTAIWHYPTLGLTIRLNPEQKTMLEYQALN